MSNSIYEMSPEKKVEVQKKMDVEIQRVKEALKDFPAQKVFNAIFEKNTVVGEGK